ncbi:hypothetical protein ACT453_45505, partial [Bacillus sp. D-CC]
ASIGVAMGEGTDVALETADVVLMKNELSRLSQAIRLSKRMNRIVKQNVIFSLAVIAMLICSNFLQFLALPFGQVIGAAVFKALGLSDSFSFVWSIT